MDRSARLQSARTWLKTYNGKNIVAGYRSHFCVDWVCAFRELEILGVKIDAAYKGQILKSVEGHIAARQSPFDQDETFAYIAGYTEAGFPYGITWEEWGRLNQKNLLDPEGETKNGIELTAFNPEFAEEVEIAERVMREDRDALKKLAE